jgi:hypothetical protein
MSLVKQTLVVIVIVLVIIFFGKLVAKAQSPVISKKSEIEKNRVISNEKLPDIRVFLDEVTKNQAKVEKSLENYSYVEETTEREADKKGNLRIKKVEKYEISNYKGQEIRRLIARDGQNLSDKAQQKQDKKVQKEVERIEKSSDANPQPKIGEVLEASNLINPRREFFKDREVIVFDFVPNPNFVANDPNSQLFKALSGTFWIDEKDKQVARLEARFDNNFKTGGAMGIKFKKGSYLIIEQERFDDEVWLPKFSDVYISVKYLLVMSLKVNQINKYSKYKKFNSEVQDSNVNKPEN